MEEVLYTKIEDYLNRALSPEATEAFEAKMAGDKNMRQAVAEVVAMRLALGEAVEAGLKAESSIFVMQKRRWLYVAAAAVALLFVIFLWPQQTEKVEPLALYEQFYAPAELPSFRAEEPDSSWEVALTAYAQQQYEVAIPLFEAALADSAFAFRPTALLGLGIAQLETGAPESALISLEAVAETSALGPEAQWYKALALLNLQQVEAARKQLETIAAKSNHYQHGKAVELLGKLGN